MRFRILLTSLFLASLACQPVPASPQVQELGTAAATARSTANVATASPPEPEGPEAFDGGMTALTSWRPAPFAGKEVALPVDLEGVLNPEVIAGLSQRQRAFLSENGFVVIHSQEAQFADIRQHVGTLEGQPYFLTTDAAFHALHLGFDELLKAIEREGLRARMIELLTAVAEEAEMARGELAAGPLEGDAEDAAAYLAVALRLFDPAAETPPELEERVAAQLAQIAQGGGRAPSSLFPDFKDDYGAYRPVGHYAGDVDLESYFQAMTWLGRVHFPLNSDDPVVAPSRVPLIVTLALQRARVGEDSGLEAWRDINDVLAFIVGPTDDAGPGEYAPILLRVYGEGSSYSDLADDARWQTFQAEGGALPPPRINSTFVDWLADLAMETGWRFMGQRFTLDGFVLQNVVFDAVKSKPGGEQRDFPSGLDVAAAFGSGVALDELEASGATAFPNYTEQIGTLREAVQAQPEPEWLQRFYDGWLYALEAGVAPKDESYPGWMRTRAWAYKDMNALLGSWTELKHDTILYTKMPEGAGGGGPPSSGPAPGIVEPNPAVFYRLAYIARALGEGLTVRGFVVDGWSVEEMTRLGERFESLGLLAARELAGEAIPSDDYWLLDSCLGMQECAAFAERSSQGNELPPVPVVAAVAGAQNSVLEAGVGNVDRIYVVVPLEGGLEIAQGGVFSYYEFLQPRSERLTDDEWRRRIAEGTAALPAWADRFVFEGGQATPWMAFRIGDVYIVTEEGADLNLRAEPGTSAEILQKLPAGLYLEIVDGPAEAGGRTWWKVRDAGGFVTLEGWVVEDQAWYERAHGQ
jgi:Protein of unknown function (DUF3160)/Bacterial SH3 domain